MRFFIVRISIAWTGYALKHVVDQVVEFLLRQISREGKGIKGTLYLFVGHITITRIKGCIPGVRRIHILRVYPMGRLT
jgi:hypothetical protein